VNDLDFYVSEKNYRTADSACIGEKDALQLIESALKPIYAS